MFYGFVELGRTLSLPILVTTADQEPVSLDALPTYKVLGPDGYVSGQTGSASAYKGGTVEDATNNTPITITSTGHGLETGDVVTVSGVGGNTNANGTFTVTVLSDDAFSLDDSSGNDTYTSGGSWSLTGLYRVQLDCTAANGYAAGESYQLMVQGTLGSNLWVSLITFGVV